MSLITDFPFHAFMADLKTRHTVSAKTGVSLSLLTSEDMSELATVEVRTPSGSERSDAPWLPVMRHGEPHPTFYDTRMGNFSIKGFPTQACSTCAKSRGTTSDKLGNERCNGHFGYISMPRKFPGSSDPLRRNERMFVINPHLTAETEALLQCKCFFCHRFRASGFDVERHRLGFLLLDAGLVGEALNFLEVVGNLKNQSTRQRRSVRDVEETISSEEVMRRVAKHILVTNGVSTSFSSSGDSGDAQLTASPGSDSQEEETAVFIGNIQKAIAERARQEQSGGQPSLDIRLDLCKRALRELREHNEVCTHCGCLSPTIKAHNGHLFFHFTRQSIEKNIEKGALTPGQVALWNRRNQLHSRQYSYFYTSDVREHIKQLFQREHELLGLLFPRMGEPTVPLPFDAPMPANMLYKVFFLDKVLVPPLPLRVSSGLRVSDSKRIEPDNSTRSLSAILQYIEQIEVYNTIVQNGKNGPTDAQEQANENNLRNLQVKVADVYSNTLETFAKKEGLFRMHMMGKRVNQACRSVISPDYMVEPNEVLLPRPFARNLTYPEQVSSHSPARIALLKRCVINGPHLYPGATHLEWRLSTGEIRFVDLNVSGTQRRQHANRYFSMAQTGTLIVHRHVLNGDRLIFNRQPTLHKVSMLGYRAKVLSGLKTLRFHYVNGKSYNADFDGDEMNIHVPQSLEAKAELECLMDADLNYLVPTSGKPIRGLIQDHLVAAVLLTMRDKFFDRDTFTQLVFTGLSPYLQRQSNTTMITLSTLIPVPAILKPHPRWTGKQLLSVIIKYVTGVFGGGVASPAAGRSTGLQLTGVSLIQANDFTHTDLKTGKLVVPPRGSMDDDRVVVQQSELLAGVVDKNQLGPSNLSIPHLIHEVYGPHMVGTLFGAVGRVLSLSLQREGFSMGMDDMTLVREERRSALLEQLDLAPVNMSDEDGTDEAKVMPRIMNLATQLQKEFVPGRLLLPFPTNQLLMMTVSGAKGSNTNAIQMALGLGQQLFDGRRVSPMNSGKTLPPFFIGERRARSFGYAMGRFSSGIRPAEYTIHAMAGRDGLIDTAVKTSRSGHLQRCLIKGLESLVAHWDHSVRDANGSVIQFLYGGDGLDPVKASTLQNWEVAKDNSEDLARRFGIDSTLGTSAEDVRAAVESDSRKHIGEKRGRIDESLATLVEHKRATMHMNARQHPLPPHLRQSLRQYLEKENTKYTLFKKVSQVERWMKKGVLAERMAEKRQDNIAFYDDVVCDLTTYKRTRAFCDAGEPVGLLAAQAAGEPSTQMTLNTFHSAGSTVTHVTEGIPRLRELLIHASVRKAAVIVPVEKMTNVDEEALSRIMRAGPAVKLADCLARDLSSNAKGYRYRVERDPNGVKFVISLLFSHAALGDARGRMCMTSSEHMKFYVQALKEFGKRVVASLCGMTTKGGGTLVEGDAEEDSVQLQNIEDALSRKKREKIAFGEGAMGAPKDRDDNDVDEDEALTGLEEELEGRENDANSSSDDDDEDDKSRTDDEDVFEDDDEGPQVGQKREREDTEESDGPRKAVSSSVFATGRPKSINKRSGNHDDVYLIDLVERDNGKQRGVRKETVSTEVGDEEVSVASYNDFPAIRAVLRSGKCTLHIAPNTTDECRPPQFPSDLFVVDATFTIAEPHLVTVVPDVLERVLATLVIPSWLPQFESVSFTREADDPCSGEMVFQGPNATLDNVLGFLSTFTVGTTGAIKIHRARSTDIHHMVHTLGVESGYQSLLDELTKLFKRYAVDYHHLTLIADAATHRGKWENYNFTGIIAHSTSPLFQMTFASSKRFLHTAVTRGVGDDLKSFSASILTGEKPRVGTACVKVRQNPAILQDIVERYLN